MDIYARQQKRLKLSRPIKNINKNKLENNMPPLFDITSLRVQYKKKQLLAIEKLMMPSQQVIAIIGANGAGKSTLIHALLGHVSGCKVTGDILCQGMAVHEMLKAGKIAWVGQHERFEVPLKVQDYALLGTMPNMAWYQQPNQQTIEIVRQYLADFDLIGLSDMRIQTLSGGEKQRMAMVRALMQETEVLLLDEPTNHLDVKYQRKLFQYLRSLVHNKTQEEKITPAQQSINQPIQKSIVMVLHSLTDAYKYADYVVAMAQGKLLAKGTPKDVMTADNLRTMYGVEIKAYDTEDGKVFI